MTHSKNNKQKKNPEGPKVDSSGAAAAAVTGNDNNSPLWCGFHNDHGTITGLFPAQLFNATDTPSMSSSSPSPSSPTPTRDRGADDSGTNAWASPLHCTSSSAGLHVACDGVTPRRVVFPADAVAFQIGETAQIVTGGFFRATAHGVRAPRSSRRKTQASRVAMAMFMKPNPWTPLHMPAAASDAADAEALKTSPLVPPLAQRFVRGATFDDFTRATLGAFY